MKKFFNKIKTKIVSRYKKTYNIIHDLLVVLIGVLTAFYPWLILIYIIVILIALIVSSIANNRFIKQATGNGIIYGGRGKGKGLLLNHRIRKDKSNPFCNVKYGDAELLDNPAEYLNSITPNDTNNFINGDIKIIEKNEKFEKRNVYIDDVNLIMPNWSDAELKKKYKSMPPLLAINRHLYDNFMIITTQDIERPWKILRELQGDFSIRAIKTYGFGFFWNCIPILRYFVYTKYIYHELPKSAGMLPFKAVGAVNEVAKHGYLTSGQATKEVYEASNGVIKYGFVLQLKKHINYDTRWFHQVVFGTKAPSD